MILADSPETIPCPTGTCDVATCCQDFVAAPEYITLPEGFPKYVYADADEADQACQAKHPDLRLCTKDQVRDLADTMSICASAWWVTAKDENNVITTTDRGWYVGEDFAASCGGSSGERTWKPASGMGAAHCCVPSYIKSGYRTIGGDYDREDGEAWCLSQGYSYSLCTKDQLQTVSMVRCQTSACLDTLLLTKVGGKETLMLLQAAVRKTHGVHGRIQGFLERTAVCLTCKRLQSSH